ncbi:MAG: hypothetical protein LUE92_04065 [Clostridiales bacterium]|nr:hypothetical protein [Clostridiales bacterium]
MSKDVMPTKEELRRMAEIDVREVDPKSLKNLEDVQIDTSLPKRERAADYIRQIGNPYCYISHGVVVKISFSGKRSMEECLCSCLSMES